MEKVMKSILEHTASGRMDKQAALEVLELLRSKGQEPEEPIAIIGVASRLPGSDDSEQFWNLIQSGTDAIRQFPDERAVDIRDYLRFKGTPDEHIAFGEGAFLEDIDKFDYPFFRLSPKEASLMDPNQRLFMQVGYHALEDAGYGGDRLTGSRTGVYTGFSDTIKDKYQQMIVDVDPASVPISIAANLAAMIPTRLSYLLDLKGPTVLIDTACSSGLVTVHMACQGIRQGDCDMAVAGAVKIHTVPIVTDVFTTGVESSDYRTRTFDEHADGAGIGEGCVAVVLKSLKQAVQDGDQIYAVIKGSALNQDGTSMGITAPNPEAQTDVITRAWEKAGVDPESISYIETHGTGTELGDVLEMEGLKNAFARFTDKKNFCAIGSVKPNIGHLYECAGMANLLKAVLALKYKELPPTIHFGQPNRKIDFIDSPIYINAKLREWKSQEKRRCGVSSFGFSGTNCHLILEEAPTQREERMPKPVPENIQPFVLTLSAKTKSALNELTLKYVEWLSVEGEIDLHDLCFTANNGRGHFEHRLAFVFKDAVELKQQLEIFRSLKGSWQFDRLPKGVQYGAHRISGQQQLNTQQSGDLTEGERRQKSAEANTQLHEWLKQQDWTTEHAEKLGNDYVSGARINWELLYSSPKVQNYSLPLYPFEGHRCWLDIPKVISQPSYSARDAMHYQLGWVAAPKLESIGSLISIESQAVLILKSAQDLGWGKRISDGFRDKGYPVIEVQLGSSTAFIHHGQHVDMQGCQEDFDQLFTDLKGRYHLEHIVYVGANAPLETKGEQGEASTDEIYLFRAVKALQSDYSERSLKLSLLTNQAFVVDDKEVSIHAERAVMTGLGKAIAKENPDWLCKAMDTDDDADVEAVLEELLHVDKEYQIAIRQGQRYALELQPMDPSRLKDDPLVIREGGIYIITGGLGDIGLEMAKYLASRQNVNLALISRTAFPNREQWPQILEEGTDTHDLRSRIEEVMAIEALGSKVYCYAGDVSDVVAMEQIITAIRDQDKSNAGICGVIHAAGVPGNQMLNEQQETEFKRVLSPKVEGTMVLDQLLHGEALDFFILCSSLATFFPAPGQGDYIAANTYLDAYAAMKSKQGTRTITINWSTWKERGMAVKAGFAVDTLMRALRTEEAMSQFDLIVNKDVSQVLIGSLDFDSRLIRLLPEMPYRMHDSIIYELELGTKSRANITAQAGMLCSTTAAGSSMGTNSRASNGVARVVQLSGRENGIYSDAERITAQVWAETLGIYDMNVYHNYYEMGGDSVLGIRIVNTLNKQLQIRLHPGDLLTRLTVEQFGAFLESMITPESSNTMGIPIASIQESYPLSSAQNRMFVVDRLEGASIVYNHPRFLYLKGELDVQRFTDAVHTLVMRHEAFRTTFELTDTGPMQRIERDSTFSIPYSEGTEAELPYKISAFIRPFDLSRTPLLRIELVKLTHNKHFLLFDMHHMICDGVSLDTFLAELSLLYAGKLLPSLSIQYKDYAVWQNNRLAEDAYQREKTFWSKEFEDGVPILQLLTDYPRISRKSTEGEQLSFMVEAAVVKELEQVASDLGASLYMVLLAAFHVLLYKYSGQEDIVIGSAVMGRSHADVQSVFGVFINMLPLRNHVEPSSTVGQFIGKVRDHTIRAFDHQDLPFEIIVEQTSTHRDLSRHPMFDVSFILQNTGSKRMDMDGVDVSEYPHHAGVSKLDVALEGILQEEGMLFHLEYSSALFKQHTMEQWADDYAELLRSLPSVLSSSIQQLELESERQGNFFGTETELEFEF